MSGDGDVLGLALLVRRAARRDSRRRASSFSKPRSVRVVGVCVACAVCEAFGEARVSWHSGRRVNYD
jgi:hypothetical protein